MGCGVLYSVSFTILGLCSPLECYHFQESADWSVLCERVFTGASFLVWPMGSSA